MSQEIIQTLAIIGLVTSCYFLYVKLKSSNKNYKALCDISDKVSCTKAAHAKSSTLFLLPNAFYGILMYTFIIFFSESLPQITFYLMAFVSLVSVYLIYSLYKMRNACIICIIIHIINFVILFLSYNLL